MCWCWLLMLVVASAVAVLTACCRCCLTQDGKDQKGDEQSSGIIAMCNTACALLMEACNHHASRSPPHLDFQGDLIEIACGDNLISGEVSD